MGLTGHQIGRNRERPGHRIGSDSLGHSFPGERFLLSCSGDPPHPRQTASGVDACSFSSPVPYVLARLRIRSTVQRRQREQPDGVSLTVGTAGPTSRRLSAVSHLQTKLRTGYQFPQLLFYFFSNHAKLQGSVWKIKPPPLG